MPTASPAVGNAAPRRASGRMKPVAIAAVVVVVAVVAALFVFMRNGADTGEGQDAGAGQSAEQNIPGLGNPSDADADQGEGGGSAGSASAGTAKSDGLEGDWVGTLTATSHDYACYGAEKYPFSMTIRDVSEAGHATLDTTVLLHAHDRSQLKSDIDSSELDVPVEFKGLVATLEGNRLYAEYSDESKLGVNALIAITIEWEGEITDPENVRVAVVSKYGPSNTEDDYSLSRA